MRSITLITAVLCAQLITLNTADIHLQKPEIAPSNAARKCIDEISNKQLHKFLQFAIESVERQKKLEKNLLKADIIVKNGTISHVQLLDALPNKESVRDTDIALKILKASKYAYSTKCIACGITGEDCAAALSTKSLPKINALTKQCEALVHGSRHGHQPFRRLLPSHYQDGFHAMFNDELPAPRSIVKEAAPQRMISWFAYSDEAELLDHHRNLAFVQWAQFLEHDLSKPIVTSMCDGAPIECCKSDHHKLPPRYHHPACAPILEREGGSNVDGSIYCMNYVRSALATKCNFGAAQQVNQATSGLDLSQLYGFTTEAEKMMRTYKSGQIKSSARGSVAMHEQLLSIFNSNESALYCANSSNSTCFIAGDSRVNNNPLAVLIYTLFMRNHNQIANYLRVKHASWADEELFQNAKQLNLDIYRRVTFNEWLPELLGANVVGQLKTGTTQINASDDFEISNEFAVAAIRFYFSMMPDELHDFSANAEHNGNSNDEEQQDNIFKFNQENYRANFVYTAKKLNDILVSLLHQSAMKMDASYAKNLLLNSAQMATPDHIDVLSFDIQRGRDHGLQPYVQYLKLCNNVAVNSWQDLHAFISKAQIDKLRTIYKSWNDIDLIVGGISELPKNGALIGPTFSCILAEQFAKIYQIISTNALQNSKSFAEIKEYQVFTAADLLCLNSNLTNVPKSVFKIVSKNNPLVPCSDRWQ